MRELMFRGKTTRDQRWIISDTIVQFASGEVCLYDELKDIEVDVDPETVGQFTGLTDKNGKNIFEGDIVDERPPMNKEGARGVVVWDEGRALWRLLFKGNPEYLAVLGTYSKSYTIIGNIHDNGDLL